MDQKPKGVAWFGDIYRKVETLLLEVDKCASQHSVRYADGHNKVGVKSINPGSNVSQIMLSPESSDSPVLTFARDEKDEVRENDSSVEMQQDQGCSTLSSFENPSDPPSDKNLEILESKHSDERNNEKVVSETLLDSDPVLAAEELCSKAPSLQEYIDCNQTAEISLSQMGLTPLQYTDRGFTNSRISDVSTSHTISCGDSSVLLCKERGEEVGINLCRSTVATESQYTEIVPEGLGTGVACACSVAVCSYGDFLGDSDKFPPATVIPAVLDEGNVAETRPFSSNPVTSIGDHDDFQDDELNAASLETIELYDMTNQEDHSDFDDSLLYAVRHRTGKLRSFKRKILDAIASKRRLKKDYEQLAIWFGDAYMSSDLNTQVLTSPSKAVTTVASKSSQLLPLTSEEDSEWELVDKPHIH